MDELVSIIVPVFNRETLVGHTLDSVLAQTYEFWECIVVDDHSTDSTWRVLESYRDKDNRIKIFKRPHDRLQGGNAARNYGLQMAKGDFVVFLDSDDLLLNTCLEKRIDTSKQQPVFDCWIFQTLVFVHIPGDLNLVWNVLHIDDRDDLSRYIDQDIPWNTMSPLWKRDFLEEIGGHDESVLVWQDWEMHIRAICEGAKIYKASDGHVDCYYRTRQTDSISSKYRTQKYVSNKETAIIKILDSVSPTEYNKNIVNLIFRNVYSYYLNKRSFKKITDLRNLMKRYKLIGTYAILYLVVLDVPMLLGLGNVPKLKGLLSKMARWITDDYLIYRTASTHLRVQATFDSNYRQPDPSTIEPIVDPRKSMLK